ncbi:MAG: hypothetical protein WCA46_22515 [Actinocatenispora sp.]
MSEITRQELDLATGELVARRTLMSLVAPLVGIAHAPLPSPVGAAESTTMSQACQAVNDLGLLSGGPEAGGPEADLTCLPGVIAR